MIVKPRIFIGSSTEALPIAYSVQANLTDQANVTVWTQNIFQLSSNALDDLLSAVENFDFGIFIFKPDDITHMRNDRYNVVRDNVIFELGLFFGSLGKDRVFFVLPDGVKDFHLPTDLLGVMGGRYIENENISIALEPFCNQVKLKIKEFVYQSLVELQGESREIKKIAVDRKGLWEAHLTAALLRRRMTAIKQNFDEVQRGYVFKKSIKYSLREFIKWYQMALADMVRIVKIATHLYEIEMYKSWGKQGEPGSLYDIRSLTDKIEQLCNHLIIWETDLQTIIAPDEIQETTNLMQGWSNNIIKEFVRLPTLLEEAFSEENIAKHEASGESIHVEITFNPPANVERISKIIDDVIIKVERGLINLD